MTVSCRRAARMEPVPIVYSRDVSSLDQVGEPSEWNSRDPQHPQDAPRAVNPTRFRTPPAPDPLNRPGDGDGAPDVRGDGFRRLRLFEEPIPERLARQVEGEDADYGGQVRYPDH